MEKEKKHLLFVCSFGSHRSPTAAGLFKDSQKYEARYAGTSPNAKSALSQELIDWADEIFVLNEEGEGHKSFLENNFDTGKKPVRNLGIPDMYPKGHPKLKQLLREKLADYLH